MEYQISLEDKVRNALVRRKASFIQKIMQTDEYKRLASEKYKIITGCSHGSNKSPTVDAMAQHYGENIRDSYSDELRQEELATSIADEVYESSENKQRFGDYMASTCGFVLGRDCSKDLENQTERLCNASLARKHLVSGLGGYTNDLSKEGILAFLKEWFKSKDDFLAFETEYVDAWKALAAAGHKLSDEYDEKTGKEMAELKTDGEISYLIETGYMNAIQDEMTSLRHYLLLKSAELEANEVFA